MDKAVITVVGKDRLGILAKTCTYLADNGVNILDISQTILQGIFTMTMLVDLQDADVDFAAVQDELSTCSEKLGVQIMMQREEVFKFMYRL